jgi:hypothetical protein
MEEEEGLGGGESTALASSDLRRELTRLQEREALLTHLLCLEREKRVKAEQLVEAEHLACLELGQRLGRERKIVAAIRKREAGQLVKQRGLYSKDDGIFLQEDGGELLRTGVNLKVRCLFSLSLSLRRHSFSKLRPLTNDVIPSTKHYTACNNNNSHYVPIYTCTPMYI